MKLIIYYITIFVCIISCQTKKKNQDLSIIETIPFSKSSYYKYDNGYLRNNLQELDSFRSYVYTNVEPLDEDKKLPKKINVLSFDSKRWKKSVDYFEKELEGKNLSYLEVDNKIVVRNFYSVYRFNLNKDFGILNNLNDLKKDLESKRLTYKIIKIKKLDSTEIIDIEIQNKFYKVILNENLCESYLFYDKKDTIHYNLYKNILVSFFR